MTRETVKSRQQVYFSESDIDYDDLTEICSQKTLQEDYSLSDSVSNNVVIYDANHLKSFIVNELKERILKTELHQVLENGPGVFVVRNLYEGEVIDQSNTIFEKIVEREIDTSNDHFASGTNIRIWNSFQKVALENADAFEKLGFNIDDLLDKLESKKFNVEGTTLNLKDKNYCDITSKNSSVKILKVWVWGCCSTWRRKIKKYIKL